MARPRKPKQLVLDYPCWGGERKGAGRKRMAPRPRVSHHGRHPHDGRHPLHVTLRLKPGLPSLRRPDSHRALMRAIVSASGRHQTSVIHYAAMSNHLHMICEIMDQASMRTGLNALTVRMARALNRCWKRTGRVFDDRYHARELSSPRAVRNALAYVLLNAHHHGIHVPEGIDPFSSARWFDGWGPSVARRLIGIEGSPLPRPRTWLLERGWTMHGSIDLFSAHAPDRAIHRPIKSRSHPGLRPGRDGSASQGDCAFTPR